MTESQAVRWPTGAGQFNPYRGMDVHGVASPDVWQDVPAPDTATAEVPVYQEPVEPEPIPVRIVSEAARELRTHRVGTVPIKPLSEVTVVLGRHESRVRALVTNTGTIPVYVVNDRSGQSFNGFPLAINATYEFTDEDALYIVNDGSATPGIIAYIEFYTIGE